MIDDLYNGRPPFVAGSETSEMAADSMQGCYRNLRWKVLDKLAEQPRTCDAIEMIMDLSHQTASARIAREVILRVADFDETNHPRDAKGRFQSGGSWRQAYDKKPIASSVQRSTADKPAKMANLLPSDGSLKGWADKYGRWAKAGVEKASGANQGALDWGRNAFGPLAGKLDEARYGEETTQKSLFDKGQPKLQEGSHMLKRTVATVPGKDVTHEKQTEDEKHANALVDGALEDIAKRFPNVSGYLKKNPLAEVQARRAMPIWVDAEGNARESGKSSRFKYASMTGEYAVRISPGDKFEAGNKPGDMRLALATDLPADRNTIHNAHDTRGPGRAEPTQDVTGDTLAGGKHYVGRPWSISSAQENERDHALATTLHEIGHHVMFHDLASDERRENHSGITPSKGDKVRNVVSDAYERAASSGGQPFTHYAGSSSAEWFAEAFSAFHMRPDYLKDKDPIAYRTVKKVLHMRGMQFPDTVRRGTPPLTRWAESARKSEKEL